jgi:phenylalanine-4-hydroxylase
VDSSIPTIGVPVALSSPPPGAAADWSIPQRWSDYTPDEHARWDVLFARQKRVLAACAAPEFLAGIEALNLSRPGIPDFDMLSERLYKLTGWSVVCVPGLVPDDVFSKHLTKRQMVATRTIRAPNELDYSEDPDLFHDVLGHMPMLADKRFADYMEACGERGLRSAAAGAMSKFARLYWYTVEMGLIRMGGNLKLYGASLATSFAEGDYALNDPSPARLWLDFKRVMRSHYRIDVWQKTYFVVESFEDLLREVEATDFDALYGELEALPEIGLGELVPSDRHLDAVVSPLAA